MTWHFATDRHEANLTRPAMDVKVPCHCTKTKGEARKSLWRGRSFFPKGGSTACYYCNGTLKRIEKRPDRSHKMSRWRTEIRCPGQTPRFYGVRHCTKCGREELRHPAGNLLDGLLKKCSGVMEDD